MQVHTSIQNGMRPVRGATQANPDGRKVWQVNGGAKRLRMRTKARDEDWGLGHVGGTAVCSATSAGWWGRAELSTGLTGRAAQQLGPARTGTIRGLELSISMFSRSASNYAPHTKLPAKHVSLSYTVLS